MRWLRRNLTTAVLGLLATGGVAGAAEPLQILLADVTVNHVEHGEAFLLWDGVGDFYAPEPELVRWRVRKPYPPPVIHDDMPYYRVGDLAGATAALDTRSMSITINLPPEVLEPQRLRIRGSDPPQPSAAFGLYVDYDLSYMDEADYRYPFALLAPTLFGQAGVLHSEFLYRGLDAAPGEFDGYDRWVRLDTTFTRDDPAHLRAYRAGDVFSAPGPWGTALRLGGLQLASNFSTQPALITFPVPYLQGTAATPSTVDLYVDGVLRYRQDVDSGFFRIDNVPTITGAGQLTMVTTDALGREQLVTQDIYSSSQLLSKGLSEYSYSLGFLRENFAYASNDYGEPAFIGAHRLGIDERWTLGGRLELSEDVQLVGATSDLALRRGGVVSTGVALSNSDRDFGGSWLLGYEWQSNDYRVRAQITGSSRDMAVVDPYPGVVPRKLQMVATAGMNRGIVGSLAATYVHQAFWERDSRDVFTVTYSARIYDFFLSVYTSYIHSDLSDFMVGMTMSRSFGERGSTSTTASHREDDTRMRIESQYRVPVGPGVGYHVGATLADENQLDGSLIGQTEYGRYTLDARNFDGNTAWRVGTQGSLAWLAGRVYAAREIADGFAVARIADIPNVRVYVDNHQIGRTDAKGRILLPSLRSYEANRIRIEADDLPLGAQVDKLELSVAPYYRSGTVAEFPVRTSRQVVLNAVLENGRPVPEGATVRIEGTDDWSVVGMDGMIYLAGLAGTTRLAVSWLERRCELEIALPDGDEPLPHIGTRVCTAVPR